MKIQFKTVSIFCGSLLLFLCLFDPKDLLFGLKIPVFICFIITVLVHKYLKNQNFNIPRELILFIFLFSFFIPFISSFIFYFRNNFSFDGYQGFIYLKSYFFILFTIFLYFIDNKLLFIFIRLLFVLSLLTITIFIAKYVHPECLNNIYYFGDKYGIYAMSERQYGSISFLSVYFHTSPLLVFSLSFYSYKYINNKNYINLFYYVITFLSLIVSGTRNNLFSAFLISIVSYLLFSQNSKNRLILFILITLLVFLFIPNMIDIIQANPTSDKTKLNFVKDYFNQMKDFKTILFGQGLGSSFYTCERGFVSLTELTYLEIFRRFGFIIGSLQIFLMIYPFLYWRALPIYKKWIIISYAFYLIMVFFNPFYFSSNGIILLSFVLLSKYNFQKQ